MLLHEFLLSLIVSFDTFLAAAAYRADSIRIPPLSALIINTVSAAILGISITLSDLAGRFISRNICDITGFIVLLAIGFLTIFKSIVRILVRRLSDCGELSWKPGSSGIVIKLYLDETAADLDRSKILSPAEAAALALTVSIDSASTGLGCGLNGVSPEFSALFTFIVGFIAMGLGCLAGKKISAADRDLSWLGGVALIIFAVYEFVT